MLRTLRESKGISISFVAEALGINRDTVKRLESGITEMRVDWLPKLSYLYGITKEELMKEYLNERRIANVGYREKNDREN